MTKKDLEQENRQLKENNADLETQKERNIAKIERLEQAVSDYSDAGGESDRERLALREEIVPLRLISKMSSLLMEAAEQNHKLREEGKEVHDVQV